jgi:hypothetical protein
MVAGAGMGTNMNPNMAQSISPATIPNSTLAMLPGMNQGTFQQANPINAQPSTLQNLFGGPNQPTPVTYGAPAPPDVGMGTPGANGAWGTPGIGNGPSFLSSSGASTGGDFGGPGNNAGNLGLSPTMAANLFALLNSAYRAP